MVIISAHPLALKLKFKSRAISKKFGKKLKSLRGCFDNKIINFRCISKKDTDGYIFFVKKQNFETILILC